ncbi:MAG: tetratricopeptide repeat protein [Bacteroidales bacterium]|nr:tetratricopeptide repeat protein [Bacteroidales bacterium]
MMLFKNKSTRALVIIISALVLFTLLIAHFVYKNINESVDPRIVNARTLYEGYNELAQRNAIDSIYLLMDEIEVIYNSFDHYRNSYEVGVLYNNRAATYLTVALFTDSTRMSKQMKDSLVILSEIAARKSIQIYEDWLSIYQDKSPEEINQIASADFYTGLGMYSKEQQSRFFKRRIKEIVTAKSETLRRLSVSYTNLGIVFRHRLDYESAAKCYKKAIHLWDKNLTAENNLNILFNKPIRERNFIQKMFPSTRK